MTLVALCWMLGYDWEMSVGEKQEAELGRAGGWLGTNPSSLLGAAVQGRGLRDEEVEDWGCSDFGV